MGIDKQRLTASHVKVGRPLPGDVFDENDHLLLSAGYVIANESLLNTLLARGLYVDISTFEAHYNSPATLAAEPAAKKFDPFLIRDSLKKRLNRALRDLCREPDAIGRIKEIAAATHELATTDPDGAIAAGLLDDDENYAVRHSVLTAILCDLAAQELGWPVDKRESVVCAALSMNATMLDQQNKLVNQAVPLNPQQKELVREHPQTAAGRLREAGVLDPLWLDAVLEHHEREAGAGYPRGLAAPGEAGQLVRLADAFGALITARGDRKAMTPPQAVRTLLAQEGGGHDAALAATLVKVLGLFPPGTFVKLANGEVAVVHRRGAAPNTPLVASITSSTGNPYMKPVQRDTRSKDYTIAGLTLRGKLTTGYDLGILWVKTLR